MTTRKMQLILIIILAIYLFTGCQNNKEEHVNDDEEAVIIEENQTIVEDISSDQGEELVAATTLDVNITSQTLVSDWDGLRLQPNKFTSIGSTLFFYHFSEEDGTSSLYQGTIGELELKKFPLDIPKGSYLSGITSDHMGMLSLLMKSPASEGNQASYALKKVDITGAVIEEYDITEWMEEYDTIITNLFIDKNGTYLIRGINTTLCFDPNESKFWEITDETLGIENTYGITNGKDGSLIMSYQREGLTYIGKADLYHGVMEEEYLLEDIKSSDRILAISQGTDTDLLIYGTQSGCWSWSFESKNLEQRFEMTEANLAYNEYILIRAFLEDGRFFMVKNISDENTISERHYDYLPVGK